MGKVIRLRPGPHRETAWRAEVAETEQPALLRDLAVFNCSQCATQNEERPKWTTKKVSTFQSVKLKAIAVIWLSD